MVVVMMVMVVVRAVTIGITGRDNDAGSISAIKSVMVVVVMMVVVLYKELSHSYPRRVCGLINSLQFFHGIRNGF